MLVIVISVSSWVAAGQQYSDATERLLYALESSMPTDVIQSLLEAGADVNAVDGGAARLS